MHTVYPKLNLLLLLVSIPSLRAYGQVPLGSLELCVTIEDGLTNGSTVSYPGSAQYNSSIKHWAGTSTQPSACTVEPTSDSDLATALRFTGLSDVPFGIKGGGHTYSPNFSSTPGVLITTSRLTGITVDNEAGTATIGVGEIWDDVYAVLEPLNLTVAGGRAPGVGVGGFIAGGGYSWLANTVGLAVDTVLAYDLVLPNGTVSAVTADSDSSLFWALKGAGNNFGVITRITMKTYPQGLVWGGSATILPEYLDAALEALARWDATVTNLNATVYLTIRQPVSQPAVDASIHLFYNGGTPPKGIFDYFLAIPATKSDISTRTLGALVATGAFAGPAGVAYEQIPVNKFPIQATRDWITEIKNIATKLQNTSATEVITFLEHFDRSFLLHAPNLDGFSTPSSWPPTRDFPTLPNLITIPFTDPTDIAIAGEAVRGASDRIRELAAAAGVNETAPGRPDVAKYPNYAHWSNTPQDIYGSALPKLRELQSVYDPEGLMKRAGGFKLE